MTVGGAIVLSKFLIVFFFSISAQGQFMSQFELAGGVGGTTDNGGNKPILVPVGARLPFGYQFFDFVTIGTSLELRLVFQASEADAQKENFSGFYYSYLSPFVEFDFSPFKISYEHKIQGEYLFLVDNEQGGKITMLEPRGFRIQVTYSFETWGDWGLFYESLDFQRQKGGFVGEADIHGGQKIDQLGLAYIFSFGDGFSDYGTRGTFGR